MKIKQLTSSVMVGVVLCTAIEARAMHNPVVKLYGADAGLALKQTNSGTQYILYLASFKQSSNALAYQKRIQAFINPASVHIDRYNDYYKVFVGPTSDVSSLKTISNYVLGAKTGNKPKSYQATWTLSSKPQQAIVNDFQYQQTTPKPQQPKPIVLDKKASSTKYSLPKNWEVSLGVGPSWYHSDNGLMQVTTADLNTNDVSSVNTTALYRIGVGHPLFDNYLSNQTYFNRFMVELNYYYVQSTINGSTLDFQSANANNYSFSAPFNSSRLMLDLKPNLITYHGVSSYAIVGGGAAWNQLSYSETARAAEFSAGVINLPNHTTQTLAYDLGVGIATHVMSNLRVSMEYLYTSLGNASPSSYSTTPQTILSSPTFSLVSNSLLFNLVWSY